jgi:hypothetical protein
MAKKERTRRVKKCDLDKLSKQAHTILVREIEQLMDLSYKQKLDKDNTAALINYLKLLKDLKVIVGNTEKTQPDSSPLEVE